MHINVLGAMEQETRLYQRVMLFLAWSVAEPELSQLWNPPFVVKIALEPANGINLTRVRPALAAGGQKSLTSCKNGI